MKNDKKIICFAVISLTAVMTACGEKSSADVPAVPETSAAAVTAVSETSQTESETELSETKADTEASEAKTAEISETVGNTTDTAALSDGNTDISEITGKWYCVKGSDSEILTLTVNDDGSYTIEEGENDPDAGYGFVKAEYDKLGRIFVFYGDDREEQSVRGCLFSSQDSQWLSLEYSDDIGSGIISTIEFSRTPGETEEEYRNELVEHFGEMHQLAAGKWETVSFSDENGNTFEYDLNDPLHRSYYVGLSIDPMAQTGLIIGTVGHPAGETYFGNRIDVSPAVLNTEVYRQFEIDDDHETMRVCVIADGSITAELKRVDVFSVYDHSKNDSGLTAEDYLGVWCFGNTYAAVDNYISPAYDSDEDYEGPAGDYIVTVTEKLDPEESIEWEYICSFREQTGILSCEGFAKCTEYYCDADGNETVTSVYVDGTGYFELRDDHLYWTDYKENRGQEYYETDGFYKLS